MPLIKSASPAAFKSNLKAELSAGKPKAQALAIAYDVQRRNHNGFAFGGMPQMNGPRMAGIGGLPSNQQRGFGDHDQSVEPNASVPRPPMFPQAFQGFQPGQMPQGMGFSGSLPSQMQPGFMPPQMPYGGASASTLMSPAPPQISPSPAQMLPPQPTQSFPNYPPNAGPMMPSGGMVTSQSPMSFGGTSGGQSTTMSPGPSQTQSGFVAQPPTPSGGMVTPSPTGFAFGGMAKLGQMPLRPLRNPVIDRAPHVGPIRGVTGGRADARPMAVKPGSYVVPADIISHLGQGNSDAGHRVVNAMFAPAPFGVSVPSARRGGIGIPRPPSVGRLATGGLADGQSDPIPIYAADGEHVLDPQQVEMVGDGNMQKGHDRLDEWVKYEREKSIRELKNLPGPKR